MIMDEPRIRAATAADVPAIAEIVDHAYRHYIARMGMPPRPMLDDHAARVSEGAVWVLEDGRVERRAVTLGETKADEVVVLAGLAAGERVVAEEPAKLSEGSRVKEVKR